MKDTEILAWLGTAGLATIAGILWSGRKRYKLELRAKLAQSSKCKVVNEVNDCPLEEFKGIATETAKAFINVQESIISMEEICASILKRDKLLVTEVTILEKRKIPAKVAKLKEYVEEIADLTQEIGRLSIPKNLPKKEKSVLKRVCRRAKNYVIEIQMILDIIWEFQDRPLGSLAFMNWTIHSSALTLKSEEVKAMDLFRYVVRDKITLPNTELRARADYLIEQADACYESVRALFDTKHELEEEQAELHKFVAENIILKSAMISYIKRVDNMEWSGEL